MNLVGNKVGKKVRDKKPLNSRRQKIITEMRDNPNITIAELRNILGVSETAVENNISFLVYRASWFKKGRILESIIAF